MLLNLTGDEWKVMRASLSPAFTTGKLRNVVQAMNRTGPQFEKFIKQQLKVNLLIIVTFFILILNYETG